MKSRQKKILYLTYDGLSDHIGQSQVLPYLLACSKKGLAIHILSFEKAANQEKIDRIQQIVDGYGIQWYKIQFSQGGNISKAWDFIKFFFSAFYYTVRHRYKIVHCRSYTPANIGLLLRFFLGRKLIFDKRDFWIDAKVETGRIDLSKFSHRVVHRFLRFFEKRLFLYADKIVSLTEKAKQVVLQKYPSRKPEDIIVIPCCVDLTLFNKQTVDNNKQQQLKNSLGLNGSLVLGYVGSIGSAYMVPELLQCFTTIKKFVAEAKLLFLVNNDKDEVYKLADEKGVSRTDLVITSAPRASMPLYISLLDIGIFFITPSYAKQATSPTKLFEMLAMHKPVITNKGVGDAEKIFDELQCGYLLGQFNEAEYEKVAAWIRQQRTDDGFDLSCYSLDYGASKYFEVYSELLERR